MAKTSAPSFSLNLDLGAPQADVKLDEPVNRQVAEQLIVDLEAGTVDSPFIAMDGQFPGSEASSSLPSRDQSTASLASMDDVTRLNPPAGMPPRTTTADSVTDVPGLTQSAKSNRKFFRVDHSNLYVFVDHDNSNVSDELSAADGTPLVAYDDSGTESSIRFEDLELGDHLGAGNQGSVRAVRHCGKNYALKKISISQALDKTQADVERQARKNAVVRELQMVAHRQNRHDNMVALYNAYFRRDCEEGNLYILMERMGNSVEDLFNMIGKLPPNSVKSIAQRSFGSNFGGDAKVSNGATQYWRIPSEAASAVVTPVPENVVSMIAHDALKGLVHFHEKLRFVHTDVKPANLMVSETHDVIKLADFGSSQQLQADHRIQVTNVNLGTKMYMAPERAAAVFSGSGGSFDEKADIWSLGISLLEMCIGAHPCHVFREEYWDFAECLDFDQLMLPEQCSGLFLDFIQQCLVRDPEQRPSARSLVEHAFIKKYQRTPRKRLAQFVRAVRGESASYDQKMVQRTMAHQLALATRTRDPDPRKKNMRTWQSFQKGIRGVTPSVDDFSTFPTL